MDSTDALMRYRIDARQDPLGAAGVDDGLPNSAPLVVDAERRAAADADPDDGMAPVGGILLAVAAGTSIWCAVLLVLELAAIG